MLPWHLQWFTFSRLVPQYGLYSPRTMASIWVAFFSRACMLLNRGLLVWEWGTGRSDVCVRPLDRSFTSQLILTGGCSCLLPSAPSSPRSWSKSSSVRPQEAWLMLQQFCVSTGGSTEFSTGPVFGRLRHRHPDSRLGLEGPDGSTLCCQNIWYMIISEKEMLLWSWQFN